MALTLEELKEKLLKECDPDEIVEQLDLSTEDLLEAFTDRLDEKSYRFQEFDEEAEDGQ
ncbi:hypothetical protein OAO19_03060 [Gammaproteobacteria bacterium]|nr:hypothetical protein [Gammaproteobacteria bacterium]